MEWVLSVGGFPRLTEDVEGFWVGHELRKFHISHNCEMRDFLQEFLTILFGGSTPFGFVVIKDEAEQRCHSATVSGVDSLLKSGRVTLVGYMSQAAIPLFGQYNGEFFDVLLVI